MTFFSPILFSPLLILLKRGVKERLGQHLLSSLSVAYISFFMYLLGIIHYVRSYSSTFRMDKKKKRITSKTSWSLEGLEGVCSMIAYTLLHRLIELPRLEDTFKSPCTFIHPASTVTPKPHHQHQIQVPQAPSGLETPPIPREIHSCAEHLDSEKIIF